MKKSKSKASATAAAEMLGSSSVASGGSGLTSSFGGGFGSAFGAAFANFGAASTEEESTTAATASSSASPATAGVDPWSGLIYSQTHKAPEVTDPTLILAFKQLSKRDPITRLKALTQFQSAFSAATFTVDQASEVFPAWLLAQERLHLDVDRRVREQTWIVFGLLRAKLGKQYAPHLKFSFPLLFVQQSDPCKEVARQVKKEWNAAFPTKIKQQQSAQYCSSSYFAYCTSIFAHTPQTLSDQTIYSAEESQERWERATAETIVSVGEYIELVYSKEEAATDASSAAAPAASSSSNSITLDSWSTLLTSTVLTKFLRSKTVLIRRACYTLLKSLVVHNPAEFVKENITTMTQLMLNEALGESERTNHQGMLDAVLSFLRDYGSGAWKCALTQRDTILNTFYSRLKYLLKTGLNGDYAAVYPYVLPLLSCMTEDVMKMAPVAEGTTSTASSSASSSLDNFYTFFFTSLWSARTSLTDAGGAPLSLQGSSKELLALFDAYVECVVYAVKKCGSDVAAKKRIIQQHLLSTVITPALHFSGSTSPSADPSVLPAVAQSHRFSSSMFERFGVGLKDALTLIEKDSEQEGELWKELERGMVEAMEYGGEEKESVGETAASVPAASTAAVTSSHKRAAASSAQPIDECAAIALLLAPHAGSTSPVALRTVAAVFNRAVERVTASFRIAPLKLMVELAKSWSIGTLLASSASSSTSLSTFLSTTLLPLLRQLLTRATNSASADEQEGTTNSNKYIQVLELFVHGILGKVIEEMGLTKKQDGKEITVKLDAASVVESASSSSSTATVSTTIWEDLLQLLLSTNSTLSLTTSSLSSLRLHLTFLRIMLSLFSRCPSIQGNALLQDLIVTQAEGLLTCERTELVGEYTGIFKTLLSSPVSLLPQDILSALLSSFVEASQAYQSLEQDLLSIDTTAQKEVIQKFTQETGCTIQALPGIIEILGVLLAQEYSLPDFVQMRSHVCKIVFWLQYSSRHDVAEKAKSAWTKMEHTWLKDTPAPLLELATVFKDRLLSLPNGQLTSQFIVNYTTELTALVSTLPHPYIQQKLLDSALPSHTDIRKMFATYSTPQEAERVRVWRDVVMELSAEGGVGERVLFLGESSATATPTPTSGGLQWSGQPRLTLLLDLLSSQLFLSSFEQEPDMAELRKAGEDKQLEKEMMQAEEQDVDIGDVEHLHRLSIAQRLSHFVSSGLLTEAQVVSMMKLAMTESSAISKDSASASTMIASSRPYTLVVRELLSYLHTTTIQKAVVVTKHLTTFLQSVTIDQIRTHDHTVLYQPFESTLCTILESGMITDGSLVANLMKWTQEGFDAGMRLTVKKNDRLFGLSSLVRIQAALVRCVCSATAPTKEAIQFRTRAAASASTLNLFDPLAAGASGYSSATSRFFLARSELLSALAETGEMESALVQTATLWAASTVKYAFTQHAAAVKEKGVTTVVSASSSPSSSGAPSSSSDVAATWSFDYLASTFHLMASLIPVLLPSASSAVEVTPALLAASHSYLTAIYTLLSTHSRILTLLSVRSFTTASLSLERFVRAYKSLRPEKMVEVVREDVRRRKEEESDSPQLVQLFLLLSHPLPSISLTSLHFLSIGLLDRAICVPINFDVDEAEEMRHVLEASAALQAVKEKSKKGKKQQVSAAELTPQEEEDQANELEHQRKTFRNAYHRQVTEQRLDQLLPKTMQRILEQRVEVDEEEVVMLSEDGEEDVKRAAMKSDSGAFFAHRPVSLQLRGVLLSWTLVLDLLSQSLPSSSTASASSSSSSSSISLTLSEDKSSLLLSYLRENDTLSPVMNEMIEHILVGMTEGEVEKFVQGGVKEYEHGDGKEEKSEEKEKEVEKVAEPAVVVEEEDEDGNIIKPVAPASAAPSSTPAPIPTLREYPLTRSPGLLSPQHPLADIKVHASMKRLFRMRRKAQQVVQQGEEEITSSVLAHSHIDTRIYYPHLSSLLYLRTLRILPALSRSWYSHLSKSYAQLVSRLTSAAFSPLLIEDELVDLTRQQQVESLGKDEDDEEQFVITSNYNEMMKSKQIAVRNTNSSSSSSTAASSTSPAIVYAKFTRGEISMGLSIKLALCYPLLPVTVTLNEQVKLKEQVSKKWLLGITSILSQSDGTMYSAIRTWKRNLDSHFAGVAECTICYAIVDSATHQLPRMKCHQCSNMFHSTCLYKWFASSGSSKCPLCRTSFN